MEKRLIIAVAFSILIIVTFQYFAKPAKEAQVCPLPSAVSSNVVKTSGTKIEPTAQEAVVRIDEKVDLLENDKYIVELSNVNGAIKRICLKEYSEAKSITPFCLANIGNQSDYIGSMVSSDPSVKLDSVVYPVELTDNNIIFRLNAGSLQISKRYTLIKGKFAVGLQVSVKNISSTPRVIDYRLIAGAGVDETINQNKQFVEVSAKIGEKVVGFKHPKESRITNPGEVMWTALKNKYFSIVLKPLAKTKSQFYSLSKEGYLVNGVDVGPITIQPGETAEQKYIIYAGPSDTTLMKQIGYGIDESVNYGFFGGISKFILVVMKFFYSIVHSWGIAIILIAVFLNILTFPLTMKSFKSMQKMQELHPQMEKLKVQYKGNPQKLNQEMMGLYKTYKINPLSGCLPMLLQMPIFFALYQALMKSIELRCTKFLWIKDLSMPDAVPIPFTLPLIGNSINILPLVMVVAMVVQQKMSTKTMGSAVTPEQREQQKIMLIVMPIMFGFIFYNMPSGLVMYWVVNTVLTVVEQKAVFKKQ